MAAAASRKCELMRRGTSGRGPPPATSDPRPVRDSIRPSARSSSRAVVTVPRLTASISASFRSGGSRVPGVSIPASSSVRRDWASRRGSEPVPRSDHPAISAGRSVAVGGGVAVRMGVLRAPGPRGPTIGPRLAHIRVDQYAGYGP